MARPGSSVGGCLYRGGVTRALVVDDDPIVRRFLTTILTAQGVEVVAELTDGDEVVPAVQAHRPDVVLMDLQMERMGGIEATRALSRLPDAPGVLAMTAFDTDEAIVQALEAGARGFLAKDAGPDEILQAVRDVAAGDGSLSARAAHVVVRRLAQTGRETGRAAAQARLAVLSEHELAVARAAATGLTNSEIAQRSFRSPATVKTLLARAMTKLDLTSRVQLAVLVERAGLTDT